MKMIRKKELKNQIEVANNVIAENTSKIEVLESSLLAKLNESVNDMHKDIKLDLHDNLINVNDDRRKDKEEMNKRLDEQYEFLTLERKKREEEMNAFKGYQTKLLSDELESNNKKNTEAINNNINECKKKIEESNEAMASMLDETIHKQRNELDMYKKEINKNMDNLVEVAVKKASMEEVVEKSINKITDVFNGILKEMGETEKKTLNDVIKEVYLKQINKITVEDSIEPLEENAIFHEKYNELKHCVLNGVIPMLVGPTGTGKSTAIIQLAKDLHLPFYMANRVQNCFDLIGFVNAKGEYVPTQFYKAFSCGGLFLFDEVDASNPDALVTVNTAVAQGYMAFPGNTKSIKMHPNFKMVCAANTYGTGATKEYTGRKQLDASTLDRFFVIDWGYSRSLEETLINDKDLLKLCWSIREASEKNEQKIIVSTRGIKLIDDMLNSKDNPYKVSELLKQKFFSTIDNDDLTLMINEIKKTQADNKYMKEMEALI